MEEKIKFFNASELEGRLKCTIHRTGKLGFSEVTINKLEINEKKGIKIGIGTEDQNEDILYLAITENPDKSDFKINKAGNYYYVNTRILFDKLGYDYRNSTIMFDMVEIEIEGEKLFKLIKREGRKKG
jgi:hypothetical protein